MRRALLSKVVLHILKCKSCGDKFEHYRRNAGGVMKEDCERCVSKRKNDAKRKKYISNRRHP